MAEGDRTDTAETFFEGIPSRRSLILQAATDLFATNGYHSTTMEDIGRRVGIRGPSIYKHVSSKQELLAEIILTRLDQLLDDQRTAIEGGSDTLSQLRRAVEARARYHCRRPAETFVSTREMTSLEEPALSSALAKRAEYEDHFVDLVERASAEHGTSLESSRLASFAIFDMGVGIAAWFELKGLGTEEEIAKLHGDLALRMIGVSL